MNDLPEQEVAIYNAARRLAAAERAAYLDQACAGDAALRRRLDKLLRVDEEAGDFLEKPALANPNALAMSGGTNPPSLPPSEKPGDRIGPYKLLQQIGEGGCGVVYMAEQEAPIRRRVALKVVKLGMDTKQVIARFEAERQALALMDHPNIARVLDAGATETGRPYFVMELVRGTRITDYCDQQSLSTRARLDLFIQVCQAIQHAHQKGIIHRDIKPSNILVTINDGVAVPKVIDFGIAKATQGRLTDLTLFTAFEQFIGTPAYMSPEQAVLTSLDVDTRSDIYSLGVLLYELLTGQTPFDSKELLAKGLDEMRRTIREQEPRRPSNRLTSMDESALTTTAQRRQTDPPKLVHLVQGDLDWIVMKCLEKDRSRRYETANGLAFDLRRHLNNEPVLARPPSGWYRFQKMARRNKLAFAAAGAVAAALILGIVVSSWQAVRAARAEREQSNLRQEADAAGVHERNLRLQVEAREKIARAKDMVLDSRNFDAAEKLLNEIPLGFVRPDSAHAALRRQIGALHAMRNERREALTNFSILMRVNTLDNLETLSLDFQLYAPVMIEFGENSAYEDFRRSVVSRIGSTAGPLVADRISRMALLLPADDNLMGSLRGLPELIMSGQNDPTWSLEGKCWGRLALAVFDYRRGSYSNAIEWCQQSFQVKTTLRECQAQAILAMACHQLNRGAEARAALALGWKLEDGLSLSASGQQSDVPQFAINFSDMLFARTLLREASSLIEGRPEEEDRGFEAAQNALGHMYGDGIVVRKDPAEAAKWYRKAADQGQLGAQVSLGVMYANGQGVPKDAAEAVKWFRKAADQGHVQSQVALGTSYETGTGVAANAAEAVKWLRKAAEQKDTGALNELARILATSPDSNVREGASAVSFAQSAVAATDRKTSSYLDTLAAAYAETGQFDKAIGAQKEAITLLKTEEEKQDYTSRLKLYESNTPYRESPLATQRMSDVTRILERVLPGFSGVF